MPRQNSTTWNVTDPITALRLNNFNEDLDDIYNNGDDRLRIIWKEGLNIEILPGYYRVWQNEGYFEWQEISLNNNSENFIMLDEDGLIVNHTSWQADKAKLAQITTLSGEITALKIAKVVAVWGALWGLDIPGLDENTQIKNNNLLVIYNSDTEKNEKIKFETLKKDLLNFNKLITPHSLTDWFEVFHKNITTTDYTYVVPAGKVLYLTHADSNTFMQIKFNWITVKLSYTFSNSKQEFFDPIAAPADTTITVLQSASQIPNNFMIYGFLVDENPKIDLIFWNTTYLVPNDKLYIITSLYRSPSAARSQLIIDSITYTIFNDYWVNTEPTWHPIFLKAGDSIVPSTSWWHCGFLIDSNFIF